MPHNVQDFLAKNGFIIAGVAIAILIVGLVSLQQSGPVTEEAPIIPVGTTTNIVTGVPVVPETQQTLPPEPAFSLPAGATAIDSYAYTAGGKVYFRSLTGPEPLEIPEADGSSFVRLNEFISFPGTEVVNDCGAAPIYAYYGDNGHTYLYQVWRTPTFRSSRIEVIVGTNKQQFSIDSATTASFKNRTYAISYAKATTTCSLKILRTDS